MTQNIIFTVKKNLLTIYNQSLIPDQEIHLNMKESQISKQFSVLRLISKSYYEKLLTKPKLNKIQRKRNQIIVLDACKSQGTIIVKYVNTTFSNSIIIFSYVLSSITV